MALWSLEELLVVSIEYAQSYKSSKYKIDESGKLKNTKNQGTVTKFYNDISNALLIKDPLFKRSAAAIKGKEIDLIDWHKHYFAAIEGSGNASVENLHYTFIPPAKESDNETAKIILENLYSAFAGTPRISPEVVECGIGGDPKLSVKQRKLDKEEITSDNNNMINKLLKRFHWI